MNKEKKRAIACSVIAIFGSLLLWIYVISVISPDMTDTFYNIPVTFSGEEILSAQNLKITSGSDSTVTVKLSGSRTVIASLTKDNIIVTVDVSKIRAADTFTRNVSVSFSGVGSTSSISTQNIEPQTVTFTVEELVEKEIPVRVDYSNTTTAEGYVIDSVTPTVDSITVTGTASQVEPLYRAIAVLEENNIKENAVKTLDYQVVDENNNVIDISKLNVDVSQISVNIKLLYTKQIPLTIDIVPGGGATKDNLDWSVEPQYITVSGEESVLKALNSIALDTVYMEDIDEETQIERSIILPDDVVNESGEISAVITMKPIGLYYRTIVSGNMLLKNVPEGYHAELITDSITIELRSNSDEIENLAESDFTIIVDLSAYGGVSGDFETSDVRVTTGNDISSHIMSVAPVKFTLMTEEAYNELLEAEETQPQTK